MNDQVKLLIDQSASQENFAKTASIKLQLFKPMQKSWISLPTVFDYFSIYNYTSEFDFLEFLHRDFYIKVQDMMADNSKGFMN